MDDCPLNSSIAMHLINEQRCWYELNIDTSGAIVPGWTPPTGSGDQPKIWYGDAGEVVSDKWIDYLGTLGLCPKSAMVFYRPALCSNDVAHIDTMNRFPDRSVTASINWVIDGAGSSMRWYQTPEGDAGIRWTPAGTPYRAWPVTSLNEIDAREIGSIPTLVRVDIPHAIMVGNRPRWCISIRFKDNFASWCDAVATLSSAGLLSTDIDR